ncbi:HPP family protein [Candidatus Fermentibacteria bacterium]|nr:HPP family protein [Candidatus Fermentibacteria bacterium]
MPRILDRKLKHHVFQYVFQSLLAALLIFSVLLILDVFQQTAIIASLGASTFIVFAAPRSHSATPRALLGGYLVGAAAGILIHTVFCSHLGQPEEWTVLHAVAGALSVGLSILVMTLTDTEHPPASGVALAFVLNEWDPAAILVVIGSVGLLALVKIFLGRKLLDLV